MSDHGEQSSGASKWSTILKIGGAGCAIVLVVLGLLLGLGVFRVATCCSEFEELGRVANQVQTEGHGFAMALHEGDVSRAYGMLDESLQEDVQQDAFEAQLEPWRDYLDSSLPHPIRLDVNTEEFDMSDISGFNRWHLRTQFGAPDAGRVAQLRMLVESHVVDGDEVQMRVRHWEMDEVERRLRDDPYMSLALRVDDKVRQGRWAELQRRLVGQGELGELSEGDLEERFEDVRRQGQQADRREPIGLFALDHPDWIVARVGYVEDEAIVGYVDFTVGWRDEVLEFDGPHQWIEDEAGDADEAVAPTMEVPEIDSDAMEEEFNF